MSLQNAVPWTKRAEVFRDASLVVVPSRSEPFGMVVLEAMQQGVPVLFDRAAGVGEFIKAGIRIESSATEKVGRKVVELLGDQAKWQEEAVTALREVAEYPARGYEEKLMTLWANLVRAPKPQTPGAVAGP